MKKLSFKKNKEGSNLSIGEATTETLPHRFLNDFFLQVVTGRCMFRRSSDSEDSRDYNWCRLWETPSMKSQRRYTRAWVHPLPSDLPLPEVLVVPIHPTGLSEFIAMSSNPANPPIEDQFLHWRQEMEAKQ